MPYRTVLALLAPLLLFVASPAVRAGDYVSILGSVVVARALEGAADNLKKDYDVEFRAIADSSSDAIEKMARGVVDIAMSSRMMTAEEKAAWPDKRFQETVIGQQTVVVIVSDELWRAGIHALSKEQLRAIYERDIQNWREVGGPDREITFFNRESAHGVWDLYVMYLYGDVRKAPLSKAEVVDNAEDARLAVEFKSSSYSLLEFSDYKQDGKIHALGLKQPNGTVIDPSLATIANGSYEVVRPLVLITSQQPTGKVRDIVEYMLSPKGQEAVRVAGNVPVADIEKEQKKK